MAARPNPMIAAVLKEVPGPESTRAQRISWLRMIALAMDTVYGAADGAIDIPDFIDAGVWPRTATIPDRFLLNGEPVRVVATEPAASARPGKQVIIPPGMPPLQPASAPPVAGLTLVRTRFFIDRQGIARSDPGGAPANFEDGRGEIWFDERGESGDLGAILWADGSTGVAGKPIEVSAAARKAG